jgi:hypothetical protein
LAKRELIFFLNREVTATATQAASVLLNTFNIPDPREK